MGFTFGFVGGFIAGGGIFASRVADISQSVLLSPPPVGTPPPAPLPYNPIPTGLPRPPMLPSTPILPLPPQQPVLIPRG